MVWTTLHAHFDQVLRQRQLLYPDQTLLVAFSGGQDSLCLLKLLIDLQPKWRLSLIVAHCDHRWPPNSRANAQHVAQIAHQWQLPYCERTAPAVLKGEAEGRTWRYQALAEIALEHHAHHVVTGHTASDRAETLLYNLIRGSGADGLQALTWQRSLTTGVQLTRPLLEVTRLETGNFCQQLDLPIWVDGMNQDLQYRRNRLRQRVLPYLREHFNPRVDLSLAHTAELLTADVEYLESAAQALLQSAQTPADCFSPEPTGQMLAWLRRDCLRAAPLSLQRRAIRQFLYQTLGRLPNFAQVEKVTRLISAPNRSRSDPLMDQVVAIVSDPWLGISPLPQALRNVAEYDQMQQDPNIT
jgi:tRNA(Ile)-lysidine synthase